MWFTCSCLCFFFSSRRRHTRWPRDWSSDVCSSDLHEHTLTHATARKQAQALASAYGNQRVDGANADIQRLADGVTFEGVDLLRRKIQKLIAHQWAGVVQGLPQAIDHAPQQLWPYAHALMPGHRYHPCARLQTLNPFDGHQIDNITGKANHFGFNNPALFIDHLTLATYRHV